MSVAVRLFAWFFVAGVLLFLSLVVLPVVVATSLMLVFYELSPWRRRRILDYEMSVIQTLRTNGEVRGRELRRTINATARAVLV